MKRSKLIQVLSSFTSSELLSFQRFLKIASLQGDSRAKNAQALYSLIKKYHPDFDHPALVKEKVYARLFPQVPYRSGKLEKYQSVLFQQIQTFIVFQYAQDKSELHQQAALYSFFAKKKLTNLAEAQIKKFQKIVTKESRPTTHHFYQRFIFEGLVSKNEILTGSTQKPKHLPEAIQSLDHYYLLTKLDLACQLLSFNRLIVPIEMGKSLRTIELLTPLLETAYFDVPLIKVYYKAYKLLRASSENAAKEFSEFEQELIKYEDSIPLVQLKLLNAIIRNYSIVQYHKGTESYLSKAFSLYQKHLEEGYLYYEQKLLPSTLANIVIFGLRLKKYDWVYRFLQDHKNKITGTSDPEGAFQLNLANYYFHISEYEKALDALDANSEDTYYKLSGKRMEIKIYYEMNHVLLPARIDAFKIYIYRLSTNQISLKQKEGNRNFIDLLKQIHLPKTFQNAKRVDKLIGKINDLDSITEKIWLLEKLEALR